MSEMIKNRNIKYNKNERCFEKIFKEYKGLLTFIASSYLNNLEDIKDIVQDSFISFFNNFFFKNMVNIYRFTYVS